MGHQTPEAFTAADFLGSEIRAAREARGVQQVQLARATGYSKTYVSRVEAGTLEPSVKFAEGCDRLFGTPGTIARLRERARNEPSKWFSPYLRLEPEARRIQVYSPLVVPGILQTHAYASALFGATRASSPESVRKAADARVARKEILRAARPTRMWAIVHEAVLRTVVGGRPVMAEQLAELARWAASPSVTVQVYPSDAATPAATQHFVLLDLADGARVLWCDTLTRGQLTEDQNDVDDAAHAYDCLQVEALPPAASADRLREICEEYHDP